MLNIHEKYLSGVPVIISGETGVGKTQLLKMMSKLWKQSLLAKLKLERKRLLDFLEDIMENVKIEDGTIGNFPKYVYKDIKTVNAVLSVIQNKEHTKLSSEECVHFKEALISVLNHRYPDKDAYQSVYSVFVPDLLVQQYEPFFGVIDFPDCSIVDLFAEIRNNLENEKVNHGYSHLILYHFYYICNCLIRV